MKYFGTDGIRGDLTFLTEKLIKKIAKAIVLFFKKHKLPKKLLVGNDSRLSSDYILSVLCSTLLKNGIEVHNVGICSSPCLAFLTKKFNYPLSLMLSASHNPAEYNGLKFFNNNGEKVNDEFEEEFENLMDKNSKLKNANFSKLIDVKKYKNSYLEHLKQHIKCDFPVIFDCANGGTSEICSLLLPKQEKININPTGENINHNAGCTHLEMLKRLCIKKQKIGCAFDGDGDRIHFIDAKGNTITGDEILYILSKFYLKINDICIGTIYTNSALEEKLKDKHIELKRSDVGDKNVYAFMQQIGSKLGGEDSGHIILKPFMNTGDGIFIAILVLNILQSTKLSFEDLLKDYTPYFQLRKNIKLEKLTLPTADILKNEKLIKEINKLNKESVKVIIRPSGTEPVLRLFVEHSNIKTATNTLNKLDELICNISSNNKIKM